MSEISSVQRYKTTCSLYRHGYAERYGNGMAFECLDNGAQREDKRQPNWLPQERRLRGRENAGASIQVPVAGTNASMSKLEGKHTTKALPCSGTDSTSSVARWRNNTCRTIARPRPVPWVS